MTISRARRLRFRSLALASVLMLATGAAPRHAAADDGADYTIAPEDGYGISDCMHDGQDCGRVIADSWCESHGHTRALAFGLKSDFTGSVKPAAPVSTTPVAATPVAATDTSSDAVVIHCGD